MKNRLDSAVESCKSKLADLSCLRMTPTEKGLTKAFSDNQSSWITYLAMTLLESDFRPLIIVAVTNGKNVLMLETLVGERPIIIAANGCHDSVDEALFSLGLPPANKYVPFVAGDHGWSDMVPSLSTEPLVQLLTREAPSKEALISGMQSMFFEMIRLWFDGLKLEESCECH
ncbi:hypothetical protein [Vibrio penaeicida]|uniref:Uncharacterized protein n=1 Tax=Vibrio penaeicida TaxID=104609 RepID=A0AAV5NL80_9VIBR|nr:hypothetical protein [Vibrio penaeicida]RTZ24076.1 hypothetical protein EKN09_05570 [Vibrio penaeicida]GLQ70977.1 hypothetical protein GCM10007932_03370 [Vibrio penaeicida]